MKCLGILAGPRKGHATDKVIDAVLAGLKDGRNDVEKISLYDYNIKPCMGCSICNKTKKCVIDDDQRIIIEKVKSADVIVFGSPAYWSNVSSEAKKFMDRSVELFEMKTFGPKRTDKKPAKVVLVTACGAPYPFSHLMGIIPGALRAMKVYFGCMSAKIYTIYAAGMMDPQKSLPSQKLLKKAYNLGKSL